MNPPNKRIAVPRTSKTNTFKAATKHRSPRRTRSKTRSQLTQYAPLQPVDIDPQAPPNSHDVSAAVPQDYSASRALHVEPSAMHCSKADHIDDHVPSSEPSPRIEEPASDSQHQLIVSCPPLAKHMPDVKHESALKRQSPISNNSSMSVSLHPPVKSNEPMNPTRNTSRPLPLSSPDVKRQLLKHEPTMQVESAMTSNPSAPSPHRVKTEPVNPRRIASWQLPSHVKSENTAKSEPVIATQSIINQAKSEPAPVSIKPEPVDIGAHAEHELLRVPNKVNITPKCDKLCLPKVCKCTSLPTKVDSDGPMTTSGLPGFMPASQMQTTSKEVNSPAGQSTVVTGSELCTFCAFSKSSPTGIQPASPTKLSRSLGVKAKVEALLKDIPPDAFEDEPEIQPTAEPGAQLSPEARVAYDRWRSKIEKIDAAINAWEPSLTLPMAPEEDPSTSADAPPGGLVKFDADQMAAINAAYRGESFFLTGSAGTGKSLVLKQIIALLRRSGRKVAVTASTGCAAVALQGSTIHSFSGVGIGLDTHATLARKARGRVISSRLSEPDVLVIDEVSMIDSLLFDKIELMCSSGRENLYKRKLTPSTWAERRRRRTNRESEKEDNVIIPPFGGLQVILCGDFFQLPPVKPSDRTLQLSNEKFFAFEAKTWASIIKKTFVLRKVHRQSNRLFIAMLNEIRLGHVSNYSRVALQSCFIPTRAGVDCSEADENGQALQYTKLFSYRRQVSEENTIRLRALRASAVAYRYHDSIDRTSLGALTVSAVHTLLKNTNAEEEIELKEGARVLCLKNLDVAHGIVNGAAGSIVGFTLPKEVRLKRMQEKKDATEDQVATLQGLLEEDIKSLSDEELKKSLNETEKGPGGECLMRAYQAPIVPVVRFDNGMRRAMEPEKWEVYNMRGEPVACRWQIPLALGWALSIHKAQGMTLGLVETDLAGAFDCGQVYVALSRATSMQGLRLTSFRADVVRAHEKVKRFYEENCRVKNEKDEGEEMKKKDMNKVMMDVESIVKEWNKGKSENVPYSNVNRKRPSVIVSKRAKAEIAEEEYAEASNSGGMRMTGDYRKDGEVVTADNVHQLKLNRVKRARVNR